MSSMHRHRTPAATGQTPSPPSPTHFLHLSTTKLHHLSALTSAPGARDPPTLRQYVLIQSAIDVAEREVVRRTDESARMGGGLRRIESTARGWMQSLGEEEEEEEDEEEQERGQEEWFEQTWASLQQEETPSSNRVSFSPTTVITPVDVHVIPVEMDDDEAEELEFGSWSSSEDIMSPTNTQNFFAPLPAPVSTITYDDRISEDERDEIYAMLPESPRLRPTVVKDKMYQSASPASPSVPPILPTPTITRATAPPVEKVHPSDVFSDSDSSSPYSSDADTDGEETEDDELPITPPQDVLDDFSDVPVPVGSLKQSGSGSRGAMEGRGKGKGKGQGEMKMDTNTKRSVAAQEEEDGGEVWA